MVFHIQAAPKQQEEKLFQDVCLFSENHQIKIDDSVIKFCLLSGETIQ